MQQQLTEGTRPMTQPVVQTLTPRIAILGAGHVGPALARVALETGLEVSIAASGDPAQIELITRILSPGAVARWAADAVAESDIVILAIPLHRFASFDPELVAGKLVVDTMNYWPPTDGVQSLFEDERFSSSEIVRNRLAESTVVKAFNHIGYHEIESERHPEGAPERRALGVAGDDPASVELVASVVDRIGYDVVRLDSLAAGRAFEPGGPVFGASLSLAEFDDAVREEVAA
jgi:predicted dinucleotide-binding enzyme